MSNKHRCRWLPRSLWHASYHHYYLVSLRFFRYTYAANIRKYIYCYVLTVVNNNYCAHLLTCNSIVSNMETHFGSKYELGIYFLAQRGSCFVNTFVFSSSSSFSTQKGFSNCDWFGGYILLIYKFPAKTLPQSLVCRL